MARRHARRPPVPKYGSVASLKGDPNLNARTTVVQKYAETSFSLRVFLRDHVRQLQLEVQGVVSQRTASLEDTLDDDNSILRLRLANPVVSGSGAVPQCFIMMIIFNFKLSHCRAL